MQLLPDSRIQVQVMAITSVAINKYNAALDLLDDLLCFGSPQSWLLRLTDYSTENHSS